MSNEAKPDEDVPGKGWMCYESPEIVGIVHSKLSGTGKTEVSVYNRNTGETRYVEHGSAEWHEKMRALGG
ncbi:hypothetical protein [Achromobacter phage Motura]|uniref:Uncharacterized protein n=1 Tax=Achromobacter phage Motura TaxID=2591403 RepID=A0A514CSN4_9CAUD|nr:hypothetical protein H1O15_gp332 [Achromobacter phage Motura]QDH83474.1 hypothetical protein [Achromobacter phage Motura]